MATMIGVMAMMSMRMRIVVMLATMVMMSLRMERVPERDEEIEQQHHNTKQTKNKHASNKIGNIAFAQTKTDLYDIFARLT